MLSLVCCCGHEIHTMPNESSWGSSLRMEFAMRIIAEVAGGHLLPNGIPRISAGEVLLSSDSSRDRGEQSRKEAISPDPRKTSSIGFWFSKMSVHELFVRRLGHMCPPSRFRSYIHHSSAEDLGRS